MIQEIRSILFATDLTRNSFYAFGHSVQIARQCNARIIVLHVVEPAAGTLGNWVKQETEREDLDQSIKAIRANLERFCEVMDPNRTCIELVSDIVLRVGDPVETILNVATEQRSDLMVLGKHAKGKLKNALLGSVSRTVLESIAIPAVVVPLPAEDLNWEEFEKRTHTSKKGT